MVDRCQNRRPVIAGGLLGLATLWLAGAPVAHAGAGDHIRVGEAEIVPSLTVGMRWQSNPYYDEDVDFLPTVEQDLYGLLALNPAAAVVVSLDGPDVALSVDAAWTPFIALDPGTQNLTRVADGQFGASFDILPRSRVGFNLLEDFDVSTRSANMEEATDAFNRHLGSTTTGLLSIRPGAALDIDLGGRFSFDDYDVPPQGNAAQNANYNSRIAGGPTLNVQWAFFPKTAIVVKGGANFFNWSENLVDATGGDIRTDSIGNELAVPDGWGWRAQAGLIGRFTERIVLNALVGYGQLKYNEDSVTGGGDPTATGFDQDTSGIEGLLLTAEVSATPLLGHNLTGGYRKDFEDSWFTNYVHYHYVFGRYSAELGRGLGTQLEAGYRREQYRGEISRDDDVVRARAGLQYNAADWLDIGLNVTWARRASVGNSEIEYDNVIFDVGITGTY